MINLRFSPEEELLWFTLIIQASILSLFFLTDLLISSCSLMIRWRRVCCSCNIPMILPDCGGVQVVGCKWWGWGWGETAGSWDWVMYTMIRGSTNRSRTGCVYNTVRQWSGCRRWCSQTRFKTFIVISTKAMIIELI